MLELQVWILGLLHRQMLFSTMESSQICFFTDAKGVFISYTPYLTDLVNDISLGQVTYYNKISERSAFAGSLRYFGLEKLNYVKHAADRIPTVSKRICY
jgi:hypothetical protein